MGGGGSLHNHRQEAESHQPQPHLTPTDLPAPSRPSRPGDHNATAEKDSPGGLPAYDSHSGNQSGGCGLTPVQIGHQSEDFNTDGHASLPSEPELQPPCSSRLSLFSGMQLVTKGRAQCRSELPMVGGDRDSERSPAHLSPGVEASSTSSSAQAESSQPPSAFSFLNL